jgi:signal transduction histidine kinase
VRLADFIETESEAILAEWTAFAATCGPVGGRMDLAALRDHAAEMLTHIVADLRSPQSEEEQDLKSKGLAKPGGKGPDTAAEVHGAGRARSGFTMDEMVSEYRALRASVIRLWSESRGSLAGHDIADLMRFNEAIDQSLAESVTRYSGDLDRSREMFVAILGHDLRTPLNAVIMASQFMLDTGELKEPHLTLATRVVRSSRRMSRMVDDLLDFTRSRLGTGVPISRQPMDLAREASHAVDEISAAHPKSKVEFVASGDLCGEWDCPRISQVLANLLGNAAQHGAADSTITLAARGEPDEVVLEVHNFGPAIAASELNGLFSPFKRLAPGHTAPPNQTNLGLGLYIAERIVSAHGGTIDVQSSEAEGTRFRVRLPRRVGAMEPVTG